MIVAGARCDRCNRIDDIPYASQAAVEVLLREMGWQFKDGKCLCPICVIRERNNAVGR